jgi:tRNA pseudouridine55 synthase
MPERINGWLIIDKPGGITSRDAVDRALRWFPRGTRIGHTGTLDPLATGVLVLAIGNATRLTEYVQQMTKVYEAGIILGAASDTDDADGAILPTPNANAPSRADIETALASFVGVIAQTPPAHSAAKVGGRRAYDLARQGKDVALAPRPVAIHRIELRGYAYPRLDIVVTCGKGTYIRSLARDLGQRLGVGGYIAALRRTEVGVFHASNGLSLDAPREEARRRLLPIEHALQHLPSIALAEPELARFCKGQRVELPMGVAIDSGEAMIVSQSGEFTAIAAVIDGVLKPERVFVT